MFKNAGSLPESMLMSVVLAVVNRPCYLRLLMPVVHADTRGPHLGPWSHWSWGWCPQPMSPLKARQASVACAAVWRHVDVLVLWCQLGSCGWGHPVLSSEAILMSVLCAATEGPCLGLQSVLVHESLLVSVAHAVTRGHAEVYGTCWHGRTGGCQGSVLLPDTMWSQWSVLLLTVQDKEASSAVVLMTADSQLRETWKASVTTTTLISPHKKITTWTRSIGENSYKLGPWEKIEAEGRGKEEKREKCIAQ